MLLEGPFRPGVPGHSQIRMRKLTHPQTNPLLPTPLSPQTHGQKEVSEWPHFSNFPPPFPRSPKGAWCLGLKMAQPLLLPRPLSLAWLSGDGDAKGLGRGLISNCNAANRPSAATSYYRAAPP